MKVMFLPPLLLLVAFGCAPAKQSELLTDLHGDPLPEHAVGRLGTVRFLPHSATVNQIAFSPDGKYLAVASAPFVGSVDPGIEIFNARTGTSVGPPDLVHRDVRWMAWSPDSTRFAVCLDSGGIKIWDRVGRARVRTLAGEDASYFCLAWSPDSKWIASGCKQGPLTLFDIATGRPTRTFDHDATCLAFSGDGKTLAAASHGNLKVWNVNSGAVLHQIALDSPDDDANYTMDFSPDGSLLAVAGDRTAQIDFSQDPPRIDYLPGPTDCLTVAYHPDGTRLVTAGFSDTRLWDVATSRAIHRFPDTPAYAAAFSPDGKTLMMSCRRLAPVDVSSSAQPVFPPSGHYRPVLGFALAPDGRSAYSVGVSPVIHQWDVASTRRTRALKLPSGTARTVAVSRDGKFLAVAEEKSIHVFGCKTGRIIAHLDDHEDLITSLAFSPTEDLLVSRSINGIVRFWDSAKHRFLASIELGLGECPSGYLTFSADGRQLAVVSPTHSKIELLNSRSRETLRTIRLHEGLVLLNLPFCFSPDGKRIALLTVSADPQNAARVLYHVELQESNTGAAIRRLQGDFYYPEEIVWAPQGDLIAVADYDDEYVPASRTIGVYSAATGERIALFSGHVDFVRQLAFSPDGTKLFSASQDTTILIWDLTEARVGLGTE